MMTMVTRRDGMERCLGCSHREGSIHPAMGPRPWPGARVSVAREGVGGMSPRTGRGLPGAAGKRAGLHRRGFTMAEVLATVAILGILAGAALPNYQRAIERSRLRAVRDVLLTILAGERVYEASNGGYLNVTASAPPDWPGIFMDDPLPTLPNMNISFLFVVNNALIPPFFRTSVFALGSGPPVEILRVDSTGQTYCYRPPDVCP